MLAALDAAVRVTEDRRRQRVVVVPVAVAHVAAEQNRRVVEHRPVGFLCLRQPFDKLRKHEGVVRLNLHQLVLLLRVVAVMRQRMESFGDPQIGIGPHARFVIHRERDHAGDVGLERERHQIEHQLEVLGDVGRRADGSVGNLERRHVGFLGHLHPAFDLAHRVEVVADDHAVADAEARLQARRLRLHAIEDAAGLLEDGGALLVGVALAEQLLEHRARVAFLGQRLRRRPPGEPRAGLRRR